MKSMARRLLEKLKDSRDAGDGFRYVDSVEDGKSVVLGFLNQVLSNYQNSGAPEILMEPARKMIEMGEILFDDFLNGFEFESETKVRINRKYGKIWIGGKVDEEEFNTIVRKFGKKHTFGERNFSARKNINNDFFVSVEYASWNNIVIVCIGGRK